MSPEAQRILEVFRSRGLRAGDMIHPADFGDAIVWEAGFVSDPAVREALSALFTGNYLIEHPAALELTELGEEHLYDSERPKHGARVYRVGRRLFSKADSASRFPA